MFRMIFLSRRGEAECLVRRKGSHHFYILDNLCLQEAEGFQSVFKVWKQKIYIFQHSQQIHTCYLQIYFINLRRVTVCICVCVSVCLRVCVQAQ